MRAADLDRVVWIPAGTSPFKADDEEMAPAETRLAMVRAMTRNDERFDVLDIEIRREGPSYTVDTLRTLRGDHPTDDFFLILGGDSLVTFASWRDPREILKLAELVVYRRPNVDEKTMDAIPEWVMDHVTFVKDAVPLDVSASRIRSVIRKGFLPKEWLPDSVLSMIEREGLYGYSD